MLLLVISVALICLKTGAREREPLPSSKPFALRSGSENPALALVVLRAE